MKRLMMIITFCFIAANVNAEEVSKKQWLTLMESEMPGAICSKESYFRKCFSVSQTKCLNESLKLLKECISTNKASIPEVLDKPSAKHWGSELGSCVGGKLESAIESSRIKSSECNKSG